MRDVAGGGRELRAAHWVRVLQTLIKLNYIRKNKMTQDKSNMDVCKQGGVVLRITQ